MLTLSTVPILALYVGLLQQPTAPWSGFPTYRVEWENDAVLVARVILPPGQRATAESSSGAVIVFPTADLNGRMPTAEAAWQEPGPIELENDGPARFEAVIIEFKQPALEDAARPVLRVYSPRGVILPTRAFGSRLGHYGHAPVSEELGVSFDPERETLETAEIFNDLHVEQARHPLQPLFEGRWR